MAVCSSIACLDAGGFAFLPKGKQKAALPLEWQSRLSSEKDPG